MAVKKVEMFGTGNFIIGSTLYAFRQTTKIVDGKEVLNNESVTAKDDSHIELLKAESSRREAIYKKVTRITKEQEA